MIHNAIESRWPKIEAFEKARVEKLTHRSVLDIEVTGRLVLKAEEKLGLIGLDAEDVY